MHDQHLITIEKSQTLLLNEQSRLLESQGRDIYKFGFGQSPFPPPGFVTEALKENAGQHYYSSVQGIPRLREAVAQFHNAAQGLDISPEQVFVGPGSKTLLYCIMACYEAVEVLIPAPAWVSYAPQAQMLGHAVTRIPCGYGERWRVTPANLRAALKTRKRPEVPLLMILNSPGNPDGLGYNAAELEALAVVMREHDILVVSDEIYGMLHHEGAHASLARAYPEGTVITTGLSKWCGAGGWRLGVAILPQACSATFTETLLGVASEVYSCAPTPVQLAAIAAYEGGQATQDYIGQQRRILKALGNHAQQQLAAAGIRVCAPEGGFYLFVDFSGMEDALARRGIYRSDELCAQLLEETGVVLLPSTAFGMDENHLSARLAYVDFDGRAALEAVSASAADSQLPAGFLMQYCDRTVKGIHALARWTGALGAVREAAGQTA